MQTHQEFFDALDLPPEDLFLAVTIRRAAASQLGKPVLELETETVDKRSFPSEPWDSAEFLLLLESELQCTLSAEKVLRSAGPEIPPAWLQGPATELPMGIWTKIAIKHFLGPIREKITCPDQWTILEPELPPKKRRFQFEQSEDSFMFQHRMQQPLGIILLTVAIAMFFAPGFLTAIFLDANAWPMLPYSPLWVLAPPLLYLTFCRTKYKLNENGLIRWVVTPFYTFEKLVPLHEIQCFFFYIDPQKNKSVRVKTVCEEFSLFDSTYISVSEEECRWLASTLQAFYSKLSQTVKRSSGKELPAPSKTRWKIRREFDRLEITRKPPLVPVHLFFLTFLALLTTLVTTVFWLVYLGIIPDPGPEHKRMTWKILFMLIPASLAWLCCISFFFSAWREALTWVRWRFSETEIIRYSSWSPFSNRMEIQTPCKLIVQESTSEKPLYRRSQPTTSKTPFWPAANSFGNYELVIQNSATGQTMTLGDMTLAESAWLSQVLISEHLVVMNDSSP